MFGLTFEKLLLIAVIAAFIIGPTKLPLYAAKLGQFVQQLRGYTQTAKDRVKQEMGPDFDDVEWKKLDPRQYDPRRIIRDALLEDSTPDAIRSASTVPSPNPDITPEAVKAPPAAPLLAKAPVAAPTPE